MARCSLWNEILKEADSKHPIWRTQTTYKFAIFALCMYSDMKNTKPTPNFTSENVKLGVDRIKDWFSIFLAVRRGFYPNPRNAPCIKRLHALPKVVGYTLVTRFYTSKSASLNTLSMNLYTANVTSFSGTCKLLSLNIFNSYRLFCLLFFMFATGSETAQ